MAAPLAIQLDSVAKRYRIGRYPGAYLTLRETLAARARRGEDETRVTWALRDVSFAIAEGEAVGIIGANGAGKSTLLRILARITQPTSGVSRTRGRVGSLLEVGTGFHPELSGRENVFLNGAILGMTRRELRARFDEIVAFAGVERFLDTPLKRYSTGMRLRLAFAVAAHVDPEIMLVDEVLAVGDARFRERCLGKMRELGREGRTVLFVSHDLGAVTRLCSRAIWLDGGFVRSDGPSADVVRRYLAEAVPVGSRAFDDDPSGAVAVLSAATLDEREAVADAPQRDQRLTLAARFVVRQASAPLSVAFVVRDEEGVVVLDEDWGADTGDAITPTDLPAEYEVRLTIPAVLPARDYRVELWIGTPFETVLRREVLAFRLAPLADDMDESLRRKRVVQPPVSWQVARVRAVHAEAAEA
jgi:ABC-2 type transport system ATP-binding protein/lipopolysaccharide transport system ATP-binding protein